MDMKLDSEYIRRLRQERLWSQEELATASGLSLRTVQRVEKDGDVAAETLRALAATFEVPAEELLLKAAFEPYRHVQIGRNFLWVLLILVVVIMQLPLPGHAGNAIFALPVLLLGILCALTISVDEHYLRWGLGPASAMYAVAIADIAECNIVKSHWWWAYGLRFPPAGYRLYNIEGLDAVEIILHSGKRFRLGTDEPKHLYSSIQAAIRIHNTV